MNLPLTPESVIELIGHNFDSMEPVDDNGNPQGDLSCVMYTLSVHDLLSAFQELAAAPTPPESEFDKVETLLIESVLREEALKAEVRRLRDGIQTMGDMLADGVFGHIISSDDDINALASGISLIVEKLTALKADKQRLQDAINITWQPTEKKEKP
jgi:hypothetical protein